MRSRRRAFLLVVCAVLACLPLGSPASAEPAPAGYVKYLVVAESEGRVPQLGEIALRVLGDEGRSRDIVELNRGRTQPDGSALTDPSAAPHPGWILVLPWDAVGADVRNGPLPEVSASASPGEEICTEPPRRKAGGLPWAQLRLAPETAWTRGRGRGVVVAVLDSGVDADVPALSGRVLAGVDAGTGAATDGDCSGHGTALAGIVAAAARRGSAFVGVAPEATILPVRIGFSGGRAETASLVAGLHRAVAGGARVALVGGSADTADEKVVAALREAVSAGTTVVLAAAPASAAGSLAVPAGVIRVGAVGPDDLAVEAYRDGEVDVVAPGAAVVSLGTGGTGEIEGSGSGYAVPFVAGLAALLVGGRPGLAPAAVAERITGTADRSGTGVRDPAYGWGLIDPSAAVGAEEEARSAPTVVAASSGSASTAALTVGALALVGILVMCASRRFTR